jgi:hypothetical protein
MKKVINEEGFKKAMDEGKTWITLDCQISETEDNRWYWEIDKNTFYGNHPNWLKEGKYGDTERLASGEDDDNLAVVKNIWENLIKKHNPDEYFVDQHNLA